ncbi:MAG: hypothetical protein CM15mP84_00800 [Cellvibrionales bacterium]|nr:MAG: hypothetical protein CM15mP84_00800 [Cellvibrionales bacterium]
MAADGSVMWYGGGSGNFDKNGDYTGDAGGAFGDGGGDGGGGDGGGVAASRPARAKSAFPCCEGPMTP